MRCWASSPMASSGSTPSFAVTSGCFDMTSATRVVAFSNGETKRVSRFVTMPTSLPSSSTTGRPLTRKCAHSRSTSSMVASAVVVTGCVIIPDSERFTRSTWSAWSATERLRCSTPMPPCRAIAMAIRASVTVSIAEEIRGDCRLMRRVSRVEVSASLGITSVCPGRSITSS